MRINTNTAAMNTYSQLTSANASKSSSLAKLSSGLRINKAGDDAAGLAISEKMKNQISGMTQASRNAQDGISLIQTAEGGLTETHSILNRMRDLAVQAKNDTNTDDDRGAIQKEMNSLTSEIDRIANQTEFNGKSLLTAKDTTTGAATAADTKFTFQIGANKGQDITLDIKNMTAKSLGIDSAAVGDTAVPLDVSKVGITAGEFDTVIGTIDTAISKVSTERANLGATQNRLDHTVSNLATTKENLSEANSRITDVDMAEEMMSFTKSNILSQASTAMLAQANQMPQGVLQLLQ
ncbi:flagellin [Carnobacterium sp. ISL-102]|uniref:flagellin N-terminal helical domain-containing protein n=1 Tax=Carnobacterium sp. ISL-102 TaxID=2819142 RepID=UPI001BEA388F|nr:flagellin [Carnobacterium sp. ISL-102]MBT2731853.1 flagellin [Carnobacterium sp. ISL-102]